MIAEYLKSLTKDEFVISNTQQFPYMLNNVPLSEDEKDVSYDVELFLQTFPSKTIGFISNEIYKRKKLKPICKQSFLKRVLCKLKTECTFTVKSKLHKQIDGIAMGGTLRESMRLFSE